MHRIDGAGNVNGAFVKEDVPTNRPPTEITAEWLTAVQEEIAAVVLYAGLSLVKANNGQLLAALLAKFALKTDLNGWQPVDATLTALSGLVTAADKLIYATGVDTFSQTAFPSFGRSLVGSSTAAAALATLTAAPLASPSFTGTPTVPTAAAGTNTTQAASCAYVENSTIPDATTTASGKVELATNAEALAGTDAVRAVTPASLFGAFTGGQSLGVSGYQKLPGGLIVQWGKAAAASSGTVTFPVAFPSVCRSISLNDSNGTVFSSITLSATTMAWSGTGSTGPWWLAVGY